MKKIDTGGREHYFACGECPIVEEFEYRMRIAEEHPEWGDFQFDHCACDKVGDEFFMCGYCEDAWKGILEGKSCGHRKGGRAYRRKMQRKKNRQRKMTAKYRTKRNKDMMRLLRKQSNRILRQSKFDLVPRKGNQYKKVPTKGG